MMIFTNPFQAIIGVLDVGAAVYALTIQQNLKLGALFFLYALASFVVATL
jgi:hypothetical protein